MKDIIEVVGGGIKFTITIFIRDYSENTMFNIEDLQKNNILNISYLSY
jgi:hypothetical protein